VKYRARGKAGVERRVLRCSRRSSSALPGGTSGVTQGGDADAGSPKRQCVDLIAGVVALIGFASAESRRCALRADNCRVTVSKANEPLVSVLRLIVSLLLAGLISGAVVGFAYDSVLLFAPLEGIGIPGTALLAAAFLIRTEQAMVFLVGHWRPPILALMLAALPAAGVALALRALFHWHGWLGIVFAVAAGLIIQAVVLYYVVATMVRELRRRRGAEVQGPAPESAAEPQPGASQPTSLL
jgi:hypothetical protein